MNSIIITKVVVRNRGTQPVTRTIPKGTVIESADARYQHSVVTRDYTITVPPGLDVTVYLEARCLDRSRSWPKKATARITPYAFRGPYQDQEDLWDVGII